jgi:hypothetical protein
LIWLRRIQGENEQLRENDVGVYHPDTDIETQNNVQDWCFHGGIRGHSRQTEWSKKLPVHVCLEAGEANLLHPLGDEVLVNNPPFLYDVPPRTGQ